MLVTAQHNRRALCFSVVLAAMACGQASSTTGAPLNGGTGGSSLEKDASSVSNNDAAKTPTTDAAGMQPADQVSFESGFAMPDGAGGALGDGGKGTPSCTA